MVIGMEEFDPLHAFLQCFIDDLDTIARGPGQPEREYPMEDQQQEHDEYPCGKNGREPQVLEIGFLCFGKMGCKERVLAHNQGHL